MRAVHRGVPDPGADDDQRVRAGRQQPRGPHLREVRPARPAAARHGAAAARDAARRRRGRLLPRHVHAAHAVAPTRARSEPWSPSGSWPRSWSPPRSASCSPARPCTRRMLLAVVMIGLAVLYAVQDAPFLFAVQIIVYTGAILMLFLFVLMLVGVDASDSVVETIKGQRVMATVVGLLFGAAPGLRRRAGVARHRHRPGRRQRRRQRPRAGPAAVQQVRLRLRGDQRPADHRRDRRDGARAPRAAHPQGDPGRPGRAPDARLRRPRQAPRPAAVARASTPGTTRWTPRPCCPTARPRRSRSPGRCSPAARSTAPQDIDALTGSIGDGTSNRPVRGSDPRGGIDGDPSQNRDSEGEDRA